MYIKDKEKAIILVIIKHAISTGTISSNNQIEEIIRKLEQK